MNAMSVCQSLTNEFIYQDPPIYYYVELKLDPYLIGAVSQIFHLSNTKLHCSCRQFGDLWNCDSDTEQGEYLYTTFIDSNYLKYIDKISNPTFELDDLYDSGYDGCKTEVAINPIVSDEYYVYKYIEYDVNEFELGKNDFLVLFSIQLLRKYIDNVQSGLSTRLIKFRKGDKIEKKSIDTIQQKLEFCENKWMKNIDSLCVVYSATIDKEDYHYKYEETFLELGHYKEDVKLIQHAMAHHVITRVYSYGIYNLNNRWQYTKIMDCGKQNKKFELYCVNCMRNLLYRLEKAK